MLPRRRAIRGLRDVTRGHRHDDEDHLRGPVDGRNHPRQTESKKDVDRVGPGDVADRVVGRLVHHGCLLVGERVRQTGAEGDERDDRDGVLEPNETAKYGGQVADDGRQQTDESQRDGELQPAAEYRWRRNEGEQQLTNNNNNLQGFIANTLARRTQGLP